jgi:hypothetical protein
MIAFLILEFNINEESAELLQPASPATVDRKLKKAKLNFNLKGIHTAKPGGLLNNAGL